MAEMNAKITVDISDIEKGVDKSISKVEELQSTFKMISSTIDSYMSQSFKNTKKEVDTLPFEINNSVSKIEKRIEQMRNSDAFNNSFLGIKTSVDKSINAVEVLKEKVNSVLLSLEDVQSSGNFEIDMELGKNLAELSELVNNLDDFDGKIIKTKESTKSLITEIRANNESLAEMRLAGKELSPEYQNLIQKNAELKLALQSTHKEINMMNKPGAGVQGLAQGIGGLAGMFAVAQGSIGLFTDKNEYLQQAMLKTQQTMSIMMGIQQVSQLLDKKSAFQIGILAPLRRAYNAELAKTAPAAGVAAAGTTALAGAETVATGSTSVLIIALKALKTTILSIPGIGWILGIVAALGTLFGLLKLINSKQKEITAEQKMRIELQKKETEAYIEAKKHVEEIKAKLNLNLSTINNTKQGTYAWRDAIKSIASELGVSEKWLKKNLDKVGELTEAYIKMQYQVALATELSKKGAEAVIENMTAEMGIRGGGQSLDERIKKIKELKTLNKEEKEALEESAKNLSEIYKEINKKRSEVNWNEESGNTMQEKFANRRERLNKQLKEEQNIFNDFLKTAQTNAEKTGQELQAKVATVMTKLASEYINKLGIAQSDSKWDEQLIDLEKRQLDAWAKTQQEILSVKIKEANRKKDEELENVTGTEKQIKERKAEIIKTYNAEIYRLQTDFNEQMQAKKIEIENNTLKLIYDAQLVGFEKEKALYQQRLVLIDQEEKKKLKETPNLSASIKSEATAAREKENADFKRIEEKRALEIRALELETARLIFEIKTEGFERDKFLHEQKIQQIKDEAIERRKLAKGDEKMTESINENEQAKLNYEDFTFYDKLTQKYAEYSQKRLALEKDFTDQINAMREKNAENAKLGKDPLFSEEAIKLAEDAKRKALAKLDDEAMKSSNILVRMFADTSKKSSKELEKLKAEVEAFLEYLNGGEWKQVGESGFDALGLTEEQFKNLIEPEKLKQLQEQLKNLTEESYKFNTGIDDIVVSYKKLLEAFKSGNLKDQQKAFLDFANTIKRVGDIAADVGKNIINSFKGISPELDKQISEVEKVFDTISTIGNRAMTGAMIGGPVGAAVGAAVGAVEAIIKLITDKKKKDAEWEKEKAQIILDHEREMYELTIKRLQVVRKIRETELDFLNRSKESLDKQLVENEKKRTKAYNDLMGTRHLTNNVDAKGNPIKGNLWDVFEKQIKEGKYPSEEDFLKYIENIEKLHGKDAAKGLREYYNILISANEDLINTERERAEILERQKENYAGTTYQGLLDSIVNAFRDGTFAAEDFANNFKNFMRQALLNALSEKIALQASGLFELMSSISESLLTNDDSKLPPELQGKTAEEKWDYFYKQQASIAKFSEEQFEMLKNMYPADIWENLRGGAQAQGFAQASQDSINELSGRFAAIQIHTFDMSANIKIMKANMEEQLKYLKEIAVNTYKLHELTREIAYMGRLWSRIETQGIILKAA